jgi:hypothetical protein
MTSCVIAFLDGVGRHHTIRLYRVAPNAFTGGGSPPFNGSPLKCTLVLGTLSSLFLAPTAILVDRPLLYLFKNQDFLSRPLTS